MRVFLHDNRHPDITHGTGTGTTTRSDEKIFFAERAVVHRASAREFAMGVDRSAPAPTAAGVTNAWIFGRTAWQRALVAGRGHRRGAARHLAASGDHADHQAAGHHARRDRHRADRADN